MEIDFGNRFPMVHLLSKQKAGNAGCDASIRRGHRRREDAMVASDIFTELRRGGRGRREVIRMLGSLGVAAVSLPLVARGARAVGRINGLLAQAGSLGSLAGPPTLALWVEWAGWSTAPLPLLAVAALGAAAALAVPRA